MAIITAESKNSQNIYYPEAKKPASLEEILTGLRFKVPEFGQFGERMYEWIHTEGSPIRNHLDRALSLAQNGYPPVEAEAIVKSIVIGTVLTEYRIGPDGRLLPFPKRKFDRVTMPDGSTVEAPASFHPISVCIDNMRLGANFRVAAASPIHDNGEESQLLKADGSLIKGDALLSLVAKELDDGHKINGADIAALVDAVTKYETLPHGFEATIRDHCLYRHIKQKSDQTDMAHSDESIMKAISSMLKINFSLLKHTQKDVRKYIQMVVESYTLKGQDVRNNLLTPGTRYPIRLRDRILATFLRLGFSPLADDIMTLMALNYDGDPEHPGLNWEKFLLSQSRETRSASKNKVLELLNSWLKVRFDPENISLGLPILYTDEGKPQAISQAMCFCEPEELRQIRSAVNKESVTDDTIKTTPFEGTVEIICRVLGRDGLMINVENSSGIPFDRIIIRTVENKPTLAEYAMKNQDPRRIAPEEKLLMPIFIDPDDPLSMARSMMTTRALLLNPAILAEDPETCVYISGNGHVSCGNNRPFDEVCVLLGKDPGKSRTSQIMSGNPPDKLEPGEPPIFLIREM